MKKEIEIKRGSNESVHHFSLKKNMKWFSYLLLFLIPLFLLSCERQEVIEGRKAYKEYFKKNLKDPSSFKVYEESYRVDEKYYPYTVYWTLDYGAKNSWGAMDRKTVKFRTIGRVYYGE